MVLGRGRGGSCPPLATSKKHKTKNMSQNSGTVHRSLESLSVLKVKREEGVPMPKRRGLSIYDQLIPELMLLTDKKGFFVELATAKKEIANFRNWLKALGEISVGLKYFAQVASDQGKIGIRVWCFMKKEEKTNVARVTRLGGATSPKKAPKKK